MADDIHDDKVPYFNHNHYTQEDYNLYQHVINVLDYLEQTNVNTVAKARYMIALKDSQGKCPLHRAVEKNDKKAVDSLFTLGAKVDEIDNAGWSPLFYAISCGHKALIDVLVHHGANLRLTDKDGASVIHVAAGHCRAPYLVPLMEMSGIGVDVTDNHKWTPLHKACWSGNIDEVKTLLENGANTEAETDSKVTPIVLAVGRKHRQIAEMLLQQGADPNKQPSNGWSALHRASVAGDTDCVKLLIFHGARMDTREHNGKTPLQLAIEMNNPGVIEIFAKKGFFHTSTNIVPMD